MNLTIRNKMLTAFGAILALLVIQSAVGWYMSGASTDSLAGRNAILLSGLAVIALAGIILLTLASRLGRTMAAVEAGKKETDNILAGIAAPMYVTDKDLTITSINEAACAATGYRPDEVVGKMRCADLAKTPLCGTDKCTLKNCMRNGEPITGETVMETRDGKKVPIQAACSALFDEDGNAYGGIEVIIDTVEATALRAASEAQAEALQEGVRLMSEVMQAAAGGDLTSRLTREFEGELQELGASINNTVEKLEASLSQVAQASEQVSSAAGQISSSSQSLAEGSSEQASSLEEISSSLEEMASMTKQNADNSDQAKGLSQGARDSAEKGTTAMGRMKETIDTIKSSSDETSKIVGTIQDIAFQTNLLALNAAVEAARAGEAGKGFAVVAEEVRNLAQRSAEAATNTADMIEQSVKNSEEGVKATGEVAEILAEITEGSRKVNDLVAEIAAASQEQSQGIEQVNTAVGQLDKVTQQNAANAEESASAAEELNGQSEELQSMVGSFKLTNGATAVRAKPPTNGRGALAPAGANGGRNGNGAPSPVLAAATIPLSDDEVLQEF